MLHDPLPFLSSRGIPNPKQLAILGQAGALLDWMVTELNFLVKANGGENYDYKRQFKSQKTVTVIRDEILKAFEKDLYRGRATRFALP